MPRKRQGKASLYRYTAILAIRNMAISMAMVWHKTFHRYIQKAGMKAGKAKCRHIQKTLLRECHSKHDSPFHSPFENSDSLHFLPMPLFRPIETNATQVILAQRLLQSACIISSCPVSTMPANATPLYYSNASDTGNAWHKARLKGISFLCGAGCHPGTPPCTHARQLPMRKPLPP